MAGRDNGVFFFVHVMKTAGMTFNRYIDANFFPDEIYPGPDGDPTGADYWVIARLRAAVEERVDRVRLWRGHFPYFVTDLVPGAITLSLMREPVARTLSQLDNHRRGHAPDADLEELYEDRLINGRMIRNHQTKIFSMTEADGPSTCWHIMKLDRERLTAAQSTLERVDVLGFQEEFEVFLRRLEHRYNWRIEHVDDVNVGDEPRVSESFRRRIAEENALDVELYEYARQLSRTTGY